MKKLFLKMSRRERLYLLAGAAVLLLGAVVYPVTRMASAHRQEEMEILEEEIALLADFRSLNGESFAVERENRELRSALRSVDNLLFPPVENPIMTQAGMIRRLNELGPDLQLEVSGGRSSIKDGANQMNLYVRGRGRYPELLKFLYRLETHRPLILVDDIRLEASSKKKKPSKSDDRGGSDRSQGDKQNKGDKQSDRGQGDKQNKGDKRSDGESKTEPQQSEEPSISFRMNIQIHFQESEEEAS